jgi:hypothetical protein
VEEVGGWGRGCLHGAGEGAGVSSAGRPGYGGCRVADAAGGAVVAVPAGDEPPRPDVDAQLLPRGVRPGPMSACTDGRRGGGREAGGGGGMLTHGGDGSEAWRR